MQRIQYEDLEGYKEVSNNICIICSITSKSNKGNKQRCKRIGIIGR